jgi:outer membrane receptor protein involved in Fe transport
LKTRGVDVQADWKVPLSVFGLDDRWGRFDLNLVANFTDSYRVQLLPGSAWQEYAGAIDGTQGAGLPLPDWKLLTTLTYSVGPAELGVRWRHLPSMKDVTSVTRPTSPAPGVGAYDMVDLTGSLKIRDGLVLRAGISNVADKDPLQIAGTFGLTQPGTYDIVGRSYFLALQARF